MSVRTSAQFDSDRAMAERLKENRAAPCQQPVQRALNPASHLFAQFEHQPRVVSGFRPEVRNVDWFSKRDEPFRGERNPVCQTKPWERRSDGNGGKPEEPGQRL